MLKLLKNKWILLILITVLALIIMGVTIKQDNKSNWFSNAMNTVFSPMQNFLSFSGQKVGGGLTFFGDMTALKNENASLKIKIDQLEKDNSELVVDREKIKELRDALSLKDQFNAYTLKGANVIGKDVGNWFNLFTIDIGQKDGIVNKCPVITSKGLVGSVYNAGVLSSKVMSIIDMDSTISARISKSRDIVRVKGDVTLKESGLCRMDYISPEIDIAIGDTIETSGLGGVFPKGIIIGKVKEVVQTNNELRRYAIIEPAVDFKRLEEVFVLNSQGTGVMGQEQ